MEVNCHPCYQFIEDPSFEFVPIRCGETPPFNRSVKDLSLLHKIRILGYETPDHLNLIVTRHFEVSKLPIKELEEISLKQLRNWKQSRGKYIILRVVEMPYAINAISTVVEDKDGNAATFSLYNATAEENPNIYNILPAGTIFLLKEPFCAESELVGDCILWCENPSDVVFVIENRDLYTLTKSVEWRASIEEDPLHIYYVPHNVVDWFTIGSTFRNASNFENALRCYFLAYHNLHEETPGHQKLKQKIHKELYKVYFELGYFENAIKFVNMAIKDDDSDVEARLYAGLSCYHLRQYEVSELDFKECVSKCPANTEYAELLKRAQLRIKEINSDEFDITDMLLSGIHQPEQLIQRTDFKGPVKIEEIKDKGRGVFITTNIRPGKVLCISKAFVYLMSDPNSKRETWKDVVIEIGQLILKNPMKFGQLIYSLHDGTDFNSEESIFCDSENQQEPIVNMKKLQSIVANNAFGDNMNIRSSNTILAKTIFPSSGCGLFDLPSYFNHSCLPNSSAFHFNNLLIIRAIKNINEGEEATIPYISWEFPYNQRLEFCKKRGFECCCKLCEMDKADSVTNHQLRDAIFDRREKLFKLITAKDTKFSRAFFEECSELIVALKNTYTKAKFPQNASIALMYALRARIFAMKTCNIPREMDREIQDHMLTLEFLGFQVENLFGALKHNLLRLSLTPPADAILDETALYACSRVTYIYSVLKDVDKVSQWRQLLLVLENAYSGGNKSILKYKYDHIKHLFELTF